MEHTIMDDKECDNIIHWATIQNKVEKPMGTPVDVKKVAGSGKPQLCLMPPVFEEGVCGVLSHGAEKYGEWNWRETGVEMVTYVSAIKRHLAAIHRGEWIDPESGYPHIAHIGASCAIAMDADAFGLLKRSVSPSARPSNY